MKRAAFLKKEMLEIARTPKVLILPAVFLIFGFMSPLTARYINEILRSVGGIDIRLPEPTYYDAYMQFFKNLYSTAIIVVILVFIGTVVDEKAKGSAALVLTKCLSRQWFIVSKFISGAVFFTGAYSLSTAACMYYTFILFSEFFNSGLWTALLMFWVFGIYIIAITIFASTVGKSYVTAAVSGFAGFALTSAASAVPKLGEYTPGALQGLGLKILSGSSGAWEAVLPVTVTLILTVCFLEGSVVFFKRQEL
jgi:ABC-2 type transport system permease protein